MTQLSPDRLVMYRSSAGSGKTFTLVQQYLRLVLPRPFLYRHILAVTFTNKATEEMKQRILGKLFDLSQATPASIRSIQEYEGIRDELALAKPDPDSWVPHQARFLLGRILGDYGHFSVSTIESFFQRILRAFAKELEVPIGYEIEMNQELVLDRLIESLALEIHPNTPLLELLEEILHQNLQEEKGWDVLKELRHLGKEVFQEVFVDLVKGKLSQIEDPLALARALSRKAWGRKKAFEQELKARAKSCLAIIEKFDLVVGDFSYGQSGVAGYYENILAGKWEPGNRARRGAEEPDFWAAKKAPMASRIQQALAGGLLQEHQDLIDFFDLNWTAYNTDLAIADTAATFGLVGFLERLLEAYRKEHRVLLISDSNRLLTQVIREADPPFVYEKAGHYYQHFLLDEFQDTSDLQWSNFWPLIEESLGYGYRNLIVGDVKQAIYRWRNGNPQLMIRIEEQERTWVERKSLQDNWRTAPEIVDYNNALFGQAARRLVEDFDQEDLSAGNAALNHFLGRAYEDVSQNPRRSTVPGLVCLQTTIVEGRSKAAFREEAKNFTLAWVGECYTAGYRFQDMAILVRKGKEGAELAQHLLKEGLVLPSGEKIAIQVSSTDSLRLEAHPQVRWLLGSLRLCLFPDDPLLQAVFQDLDAELTRQAPEWNSRFVPQGSSRYAARLQAIRSLPLYEAVVQLVRELPGQEGSENAYVLGFLEAVWEYSAKVDTSIQGFLLWWEENGRKKSVKGAESQDAIRIMTIHQSKGLEFPVVMLPMVDWDLPPDFNKKGIMWVSTKGTAYEADFPVLPVHNTKDLEASAFKEAFDRERILSHLDNLNLLYVAMTRPEHRLYLHVPEPAKAAVEATWKTAGDLVRSLSVGEAGLLRLDGDRYLKGEALPAPERKKGTNSPRTSVDMSRFRPPADNKEPRHYLRSQGPIREELTEKIAFGLALHEALSRILTPADIPAAVAAVARKGMVNEAEATELTATLEKLLTTDPVTGWFAEGWEVKNEVSILSPDGEERRPDRVLIREGRCVVIDFKTGAERPAHKRQVADYMNLLQKMGYPVVEGWLLYTGQGLVVPVSGAN